MTLWQLVLHWWRRLLRPKTPEKRVWPGPTYCQTCGYRANYRYDEMGHYVSTDHVTFGPRPPAKEPENQ